MTIPQHVREAIIRHRLAGRGRNETARLVKSELHPSLSSASVSNEIERFKKLAEDEGLEKASQEYGVNQVVETLLETSDLARAAQLTPQDLLAGARVAAKLKQIELVDAPRMEAFIDEVYRRSTDHAMPPAQLVEQCAELNRLEAEHGMKFCAGLKDRLGEMGKKMAADRIELAGLDAQISTRRKEDDELFRQHGVNAKGLARYDKAAHALRSHGVDPDNLWKYGNFLSNVGRHNFNEEDVLAKLNSIEDLDSRIFEGEELVREAGKNLALIRAESKAVNQELDRDRLLVKELRKAKAVGVQADFIVSLVYTIELISETLDTDNRQQVVERFWKEILRNYKPLLGLRPEVAALERRKASLQKEIGVLDQQYGAQREARDAYNELRSAGVDNGAILAWNRIVKSTGLTPQRLEVDLRAYANTHRLLEAMQQELHVLGDRRSHLEYSNRRLGSINTALSASINNQEQQYEKIYAHASKFEEVLEVASMALMALEYPNKCQALPLRNALLFLRVARNICSAKGVSNDLVQPGGPDIQIVDLRLSNCFELSDGCLKGLVAKEEGGTKTAS